MDRRPDSRHEPEPDATGPDPVAAGAPAPDPGMPEHEAAAAESIAEVIGSPRFWVAPLALVILVMSAMAAFYMGAVVNPRENLHDFPVALVNEDVGAQISTGEQTEGAAAAQRQVFGDQVASGLISSAADSGIVVHETDRASAFKELNTGKVYGVVVIDSTFSNALNSLGLSSALTRMPDPPQITVYLNRGSGAFASSVTTTFADELRERVNDEVGAQLTSTVASELKANDISLSGAAQLALASPVVVDVVEASPLPDGAANGLTAFYFTLLLVLAGFTGAMMVNILVDGLLGQMPVEYGPFYQLRKRLAISRWGTLAAKWTMMGIIALVQPILLIVVSTLVGASVPNMFEFWLFSALAITAVGVTASSMMAVFGNAGLLLNLVFFVIIGLPSSGGTVPLEASPRIFSWFATVEPMHLIYLGVRAILYFDADLSAGLARAIIQCFVGLLIGGALGLLGTKYFDRKGWHRYPGGMVPPPWLARMTS